MFISANIRDGSTYFSGRPTANDYYCESEKVHYCCVGLAAECLEIEEDAT